MLSLISGENRLAAEKAVKRALGVDYEVFEGENLQIADLSSIFQGTSLFGVEKRQILLKDVGENKAVWEKLPDYVNTDHDVVVWETKLDKRSATFKAFKAAGVEMRDFPPLANPDAKSVFNVFDLALRNGRQAVRVLEKIEAEQDPYMFFGLMVTQALKRFEQRPNDREKRILAALAELDLQMKTTSLEPWLLVKSLLLRLQQI